MSRKKAPLTADELQQDLDLYAQYCHKLTLRAQSVGRDIATDLFVMLLNPKMREATFRWSKFEDMAARQARISAWQGFSGREWNTFRALIEEDAQHGARLTAKELLQKSDVETWLPLGETDTPKGNDDAPDAE